MKSEFGKQFNHNSQAGNYDNEVRDEKNPIREGYQSILFWIKNVMPKSGIVIELGCGTGNTTKMFPDSLSKIFCVDISSEMIEIAKEKLKNNKKIMFVEDDLLSFLSGYNKRDVDVIVSMYAIHHLTQKEKHKLFQVAYSILKDGGSLIFADLMFKDKKYERDMRLKYPDLEKDFDEEFWWFIDEESRALKDIGFNVKIEKFSDLSWGVLGKKI